MQTAMPNFFISERAKKDIADIWNYTASEWSEKQAVRYYNELLDTCERIASNPYVIGRSYDDVRPDLRGITCGRHIIFFRIISQRKVRIVRILHTRMDFSRHIRKDTPVD